MIKEYLLEGAKNQRKLISNTLMTPLSHNSLRSYTKIMAQSAVHGEKSMQRACFAKKNNLLLHRSKQKNQPKLSGQTGFDSGSEFCVSTQCAVGGHFNLGPQRI